MTLSGRVCLVTGASRGIGRAIALSLAESGADVAVNFHTRGAEAQEVARAIESRGRRSALVQADVSAAGAVEKLVGAVEAALGAIDILVNNAGIGRACSVEQLTPEIFDEAIAVNLRSAFLLSQAVLPGMRARQWGRLIYVSSVAAQVGGVIGPHYAASKAGMLGLVHGYASRLAREGITANAICPALIETEMIRDNPRARPEALPIGRLGRAEEVAQVAAMLASNGFITGQSIQVNGGLYPT
jgi:3-oxoacyl-[acyl-carrier protein] reductase